MQFKFSNPTMILRSFDESMAKDFYIHFLGFHLDWEHRFEPNTPLYMQLSMGDCLLHLSEHFGDAAPGSHVRLMVNDVTNYCQNLLDKNYRNARPGYQDQSWGSRDMTINDPFGNRITFYTPL